MTVRLFKRHPADGLGLGAPKTSASRRSTSGSDSSTATTSTTATTYTTNSSRRSSSSSIGQARKGLHHSGSIRKTRRPPPAHYSPYQTAKKRNSYPTGESTTGYTLPRLDFGVDLVTMDERRNAPLPPLPTRSPEQEESRNPPHHKQQHHQKQQQTNGRSTAQPRTPINSESEMESDNSIQPSPVAPNVKRQEEDEFDFSSAVLAAGNQAIGGGPGRRAASAAYMQPSTGHYSSSSSAGTSITSYTTASITTGGINSSFFNTTPLAHYPADAVVATTFHPRVTPERHQLQGPPNSTLVSMTMEEQAKDDLRLGKPYGTTSYGGAAEVPSLSYNDDYEDDDDNDELSSPSSRIKSMLPRFSALYRPLDTGETKTRLAPPHSGSFYDLPDGAGSALSFNQESARTEAELVSRSLANTEKENNMPPVSDNASSLRKSFVSPFERLTKRSTKNLRKHATFDETAEMKKKNVVAPALPALSLDESQFGESLASDDDIRSHSQSSSSQSQSTHSQHSQHSQSSSSQSQHSQHSEASSSSHKEDLPLQPAYAPPRPPPSQMAPLGSGNNPQLALGSGNSQMPTIRATMGINYADSSSDSDSSSDESDDEELSLLPLSPLAPPTRSSPPSAYTPGPNNSRIMTKSQFDSYRKSIIENGLTNPRLKKTPANDNNTNDDDSRDTTAHDDDDDDDDNEEEEDQEEEEDKLKDKYDDLTDAKKQQIRMRLRQDAHLSAYRQKMTRISGSSTALSALNMRASQSFGNLDGPMFNEEEDEDEDELDDVPLGILKAHGFPQPPQMPRQALKSTNSQPNLQGEQLVPGLGGPSILYRPSDTQSLRSVRSNGNIGGGGPPIRALPSAYNGGTYVGNRGLIGEIAFAEEARERRKSMGVNILSHQNNMRTSTMVNSTYTPSLYNNSNGGTPPPPQQLDVQQQMLQMMQMQVQLLQEMKGNNNVAPMYQQPPLPPIQHQQQPYIIPPQYAPSQYAMPPPGRPASVRSFSPSERSMHARGPMMHQRTNSNPAAPTLKDLANQEAYRMSYARPQSQAQPFAYQTQPRPSSMMRINSNVADNDDEEEDDEKEWSEMVKKRQGLKQSWKDRIVA
ncbi:hypothetical protein TRVA0_017S01222 [Trichomonascus vanleenenianus]|uniref:uncharacterized protein n=1 Tax=Trichomonascus vanleenenianus TaxID=2268995 RepID=UPI003EC9764F